MAYLLKPFPEVPLKLLAFDRMADRNASLQSAASRPQATSPGAANLRVQPKGHPNASVADTGGWHHGGINE